MIRGLVALAVATVLLSQGPLEVSVVPVGLNADELDILAQLTMAEAEGEEELGKRLVIDTVLNRIESEDFPNDLEGVIFQPKAFTCIKNGRYDKCYPTDEIRDLIREEILDRKNYDVLYFNANGYSYGTPLFKEGGHYFSGRKSNE